MKKILTFLLPILIVVAGITGAMLFLNGVYYVSAILTMTSIISYACWITMLGEKEKKPSLG